MKVQGITVKHARFRPLVYDSATPWRRRGRTHEDSMVRFLRESERLKLAYVARNMKIRIKVVYK